MTDRVVVFVDTHNAYRGARRAFFSEQDPHVCGNINPLDFGQLLAGRTRPGSSRVLEEVRMYTGRPDATRQSKGYASHMKQCSVWGSLGKVTVISRMLRYPYNWPNEREREKGIDVAMAIDFVTMAMEDSYDVGILMTTDTDLIPALEYVANKVTNKIVEVAAWIAPNNKNRLRLPGTQLWCHLLYQNDYDLVADQTDYRP